MTQAERIAEMAATRHAEMIVAGYVNEPPSGANPDMIAIDRAGCASATCQHCGTYGLAFEPWSKPDSYIAFAVCVRCGMAEKF